MVQKQKLSAHWQSIKTLLLKALPEISDLMRAKSAQAGCSNTGGALAQAGMEDGADIAAELIAHNELGLALEHLCCMIYEDELPVSMQTYAVLEEAGQKMQMEARIWESFRPKSF